MRVESSPLIFAMLLLVAATWQEMFIVSWCGMRGIVTLASALAIPYVTSSGQAFLNRPLILN